MKIAIQNPQYWINNNISNIHPYNLEILYKNTSVIFLYDIWWLKWIIILIIWLLKNKINIIKYKFIFDINKLNKNADVLISFNWRPDLNRNCPPIGFKWLKFVHLMDYMFNPTKSNENLIKNNVDYVLWTTNHYKYDEFFNKFYPNYKEKCIWVPFSFWKRFKNIKKYSKRINKCVAVWSVRLVNDNIHCKNNDLDEFKEYFKWKEIYFHKMRRLISINNTKLKNQIYSLLPWNDKQVNWNYDIVNEYNNYKMFVSCESINYFPSVKTYEWIACWSVLVCSTHKCFEDLWFIDWVNCIKHNEFDIDDLKNKINYYQKNEKLLNKISDNGYKYITKKFSPKEVAKNLINEINKIYNEKINN